MFIKWVYVEPMTASWLLWNTLQRDFFLPLVFEAKRERPREIPMLT